MADMTPGMERARRLDARYERWAEQIAAERKAREAADLRRAEQQQDVRAANEAREDRAAASLRRLDAEQRVRDQQLLIALDRAERDRQDLIEKARQAGEASPRGSIYNLVA